MNPDCRLKTGKMPARAFSIISSLSPRKLYTTHRPYGIAATPSPGYQGNDDPPPTTEAPETRRAYRGENPPPPDERGRGQRTDPLTAVNLGSGISSSPSDSPT